MTDGSVVLAVIRLLVSLAVVLVLLVALARWASKRGIGSGRPGRSAVDVEVLTRRSLGKNSTLQVVKVGSQVMVLGVTERGVSVLGELGEEDLVRPSTPLSVVPSIAPQPGAAVPADVPTGVPTAVPAAVPTAGVPASAAFAPSATEATGATVASPSLTALPAAVSASVAPPAVRSTTWAEAEGRALIEAGMATRSSARAARAAAATRQARQGRQSRQGLPSLPGLQSRQPRQSRTIVPPTDSRSARRAAAAPTGWPWNAAAVVLSATGRSRRG
ncbi:hypothetical protein GCM10009867_18490 [Pedococcus aerophilus]|uniref:Flagellar protein n=1 Tax=Pedococcus aerophilus TaxID=436356 RepID=A0ABP6H6D8_9MICO